MNNPLRVRGVERVGDFDRNMQEAVQIYGLAADGMAQSLAIEKLHGDERFAVLLADVVQMLGWLRAEAASASR